MKKLKGLDWLVVILLIIGGINWGLIGLFNFNLVSVVFGEMSLFSRIVYVLVGLSGVYFLYIAKKLRELE